MIGQIAKFINWITSNVQIDVEITIEGSDTLSLEVDFSLVASLTENEAVWSDFLNRAIPVGKLRFSHVDTNGVAGYRIAGTNTLVWRDQLSPVQYVVAA